MKIITQYMKKIIRKAIMALFRMIPIKHNRWVFGAWQGQLYADNSKFMYEYVCQNHPDVDAIWITKNRSVIKSIKNHKRKCIYAYSVMGVFYTVTAEVAFETEGNWDISPFLDSKKTLVIQLWHGVAPKKANWSSFNKSNWDNHFWMVSSNQNKTTMKELIGIDDNHIFITGYPRNDVFFNRPSQSRLIKKLQEKFPNEKKVIYMPTHRNFGTEGPKIKVSDLIKADKFFKKNNIVFVFKPHFHEIKYYNSSKVSYSNIIIANNQEMYSDVYSYINDFDMLISDYSSIIYDFTCSKKPIILFPYDIKKFKETDAGLFDYYESIPAGPFCFDWDSVLNTIKEMTEKDIWHQQREICRRTFHPFSDGKNSERVYNTVKRLLNNKNQ